MLVFSWIRDLAGRLVALEPPPADFVSLIGYDCWGVAMFASSEPEAPMPAAIPSSLGAAPIAIGLRSRRQA